MADEEKNESEVSSPPPVPEECLSIQDELSAHLDGQLTGSLKSRVEGHLENCSGCQTELESLKQVQSFLSKAFSGDGANVPDIWEKMAGQVPSVCDVIQEDLSAYLDGELTVPAQEGVNKHLKECETCLSQFTELNATNRLLAKGLELPASAKVDIWSGVKSRLNADCALIDNELSAYLDQEVVTLRHREITKHLTDCPSCREEFGRISSIGELIRESYKPEIPENLDLWPGIKSKLTVVQFTPKNQSKEKSRGIGIDRRVYIGVACAAGFVALFGMAALWLTGPADSGLKRVSSEEYMIESILLEPADKAENVIYEE
ncbi:MAG: zf-HC2 domain-containing protein [Candidatus Obscuribacterales bacterium]|nr:zf-HC2 domain-containing protein [Candidatus Obscuribacterales bacterium]